METLLQRLLPGIPVPALQSWPVPARRDWTTMVCFSWGKPGHGVGQVPGIGWDIPVHVTGVVGGEGGRQLHDDLATNRIWTPPTVRLAACWSGQGIRSVGRWDPGTGEQSCASRTCRCWRWHQPHSTFGSARGVSQIELSSVDRIVDLAGVVTVGVSTPADLAGDVTVGVSSPADLAGGVTVGVVPSAVAEVASSADLAGVRHHEGISVKTANLGKWFPTWLWRDQRGIRRWAVHDLNCHVSLTDHALKPGRWPNVAGTRVLIDTNPARMLDLTQTYRDFVPPQGPVPSVAPPPAVLSR